ncbi:MAG: ergothioneine biosynthesis protein EgtB, partial [Bacteroidota bacterium]
GERVERAYRGNMTRPSLEEILAYRKYVTEHLNTFLEGPYPKTEEILRVIELGMQHEQQHQELLLYDIKYILGHNPLFPQYREALARNGKATEEVGPMNFLKVEAGIYEVGYEGPDFHFDNEECVHKVYVEDFEIMDRLITHGEFREFVEAGAYQDYRFWLMEGWAWIKEKKIDMPFYWFKVDGKWKHTTLHGLKDINWDLPMTHISYYEAQAFAMWKGMRLPTEFQWEIACKKYSPEIPATANFVEKEYYGPAVRKKGDPQFYGDVWEWTQSAYLPYPRYQAPEGTLGEYNGKFMVNQMVLKGGSCATPKDHIRPSYRNFFHPHLQWLFNGFRLVK